MIDIAKNIEEVTDRIKAAAKKSGRDEQAIQLIAVSKKVDVDRMKTAAECGIQSFGENYVQEFLEKYEKLSQLDWHFIGQLQSNKVKYIVRKASFIHTLDRLSLAKELNKRSIAANLKVKTLIQVNIGLEKQKGGLEPKELEPFINDCKMFEGIDVCGLMCIPPWEQNPEDSRVYFEKMRKLYDQMNDRGYGFTKLSMGMSADYELAIEEGANIVRVGSAIFGAR